MSEKSIKIKNQEYEIVKELGKGGNGRVIKVLNKSDNKFYAIKEIDIKEDMKDKITDYEKEANYLSKFNCKNIVKYYDSYRDNNKFYILMEFCEGQNLRDFINKSKITNYVIEEDKLYNIIKQICIGLKEIHDNNIIHRDLKPENILITKNMEVKIGDFGISKYFGPNKDYTTTLAKAGSIYYMPPEILTKGIYNIKLDMYSLGCIIYELLNLRIFYNDKIYKDIKQIDKKMYNYKWQEIINSLLQPDYDKRMDIDEVYEIISNEINIKDLENKMDKLNINNKKSKIPLNDKNIITGEIYINKNNINKDVQIINSFENVKTEYDWGNKNDDWKYENEKEIKENVEIKIDGKKIKFEYHLKFQKEGKYKIEYLFKKNLTKTDYMFYDCKSLQNLDLSNFNSQNVTSMSNMFCGCKSLTNLNLSNFYTQNVTNMSGMFDGCKKLKNLDLSNFDTQNVTDMSNMLNDCNSLTQDNLNTKDNKILEEFKKLNDI